MTTRECYTQTIPVERMNIILGAMFEAGMKSKEHLMKCADLLIGDLFIYEEGTEILREALRRARND